MGGSLSPVRCRLDLTFVQLPRHGEKSHVQERAVEGGGHVALKIPHVALITDQGSFQIGMRNLADPSLDDLALLHTKMMVIDGRWATVGSTNLHNRSMAMNDELNVVFYDQQIAKRLEDILNEELTHAKKLSEEQYEGRGWISRFLSVVMSPLSNYF